MHPLEQRIEKLAAASAEELRSDAARATFFDFRAALSKGEVRAASKEKGTWRTNEWVKRGILLGFRMGVLQGFGDGSALSFVDKDTFPPRRLAVKDGVRMVPGGSSIREGAYVAAGVICMPPMYINVGAYVDEGTLVDSNDGFVIADMDLKLRGPGEFFGTKQSGLPQLRIASVIRDREILEIARREAVDFVTTPPSLEELRGAVAYIQDHWQRRYGLSQVG